MSSTDDFHRLDSVKSVTPSVTVNVEYALDSHPWTSSGTAYLRSGGLYTGREALSDLFDYVVTDFRNSGLYESRPLPEDKIRRCLFQTQTAFAQPVMISFFEFFVTEDQVLVSCG